jgi:hypothetical protein
MVLFAAIACSLATAERVAVGLDAPLMPWKADWSCMLCMMGSCTDGIQGSSELRGNVLHKQCVQWQVMSGHVDLHLT